jgi:hypothetical protein
MRRRRRLLCSAVLALLGCLPLASTEIPIDGRIRDSGGVRLPGVRVELRPILSSYEQGLRDLDGQVVEPAARAITGADGRFSLLAPGEGMWEVGVFGEGFVPQRFRLTPLTGAETLPAVTLRRDAGLRVRVEGPDGRPLAGARVVGRAPGDEEEPGWRPGWRKVPRIAISGADGVARLACSRDEMMVLLGTAPGFPVQEGPEARGPAEVTFRLAAGAPRRVEVPKGAILRDLQTSLVLSEIISTGESWLLLETVEGVRVRFAVPAKKAPDVPAPAGPLPGRVIDTATRQPIAGAWVWPVDDPGRFVRTDEQGGYRIAVPASVGLEIAAAGHLPEIVNESIPWPPGSFPPIALDSEVVLAGTVVDGEGRPAAGAEVAVFLNEDSWFPSSLTRRAARVGRVSALGEVRVAGLRSGSVVQVVATGPGFAPAWLAKVWLKARENRFKLVLARGSRVSGRIVDGQGKPVADAAVVIEPGAGTPRLSFLEDPSGESRRFADTSADGGFAFAEVPSGWHEMIVRRPGAGAQRLPRFEVREVSGASELGPLVLDEAEVLTARLVDPEGRPVAGAEVWASVLAEHRDEFESSRWPAAVSGSDGAFSLRVSRWQPLELTVCGPGFVPWGASLRGFLPGETLVLTLQPGAAVSGRVTGLGGLPMPRHYTSVNLVGDPEAAVHHDCGGGGWNETDEAGRFRVTGLEPGLYTVGYDERLAFAAGESREVALQLETASPPRRAVLSGKLVGNDGLPVPGAVVTLRANEDHGAIYSMQDAISRTDADGNYRLSFLKPGLKIEKSSFGIARHGRSYVLSGFSSWQGPEVLEADGRLDIPVEKYPEPFLAEAEAEMEDQRRDPGPAVTIAGRILGLAPEELARVRITAGLTGWRSFRTAGSVDAQGNYRLEGLPRDSWWIEAQAADRTLFDTIYVPEDEARITRDLVFEPVAEVQGRVETAWKQVPVAGAAIRLRHLAQPLQVSRPDVETRTEDDGSYSFRLPPGKYEVTATKEGLVPSPESLLDYLTVEDSDGDSSNVSLWLQPAVTLRGKLAGLSPEEDGIDIEATLVDGTPDYKKPIEGKMVAEGRYEITGLGPGTWKIEATYEIFGTGERKATGTVVIPEEATEAGLDLGF